MVPNTLKSTAFDSVIILNFKSISPYFVFMKRRHKL